MKTLQTIFLILVISAFSVSAQVQSMKPKINILETLKTDEPIKTNHFEYSGSATINVILNGINHKNKAYCLYSTVNDEIRGISRGMYFSPTEQWLHTHMLYSNLKSGDTIQFMLFDQESKNWYKFKESLAFEADMVEANAFKPFKLQDSHIIEPLEESLEALLNVFPNQSGGQTTISYSIHTNQRFIIEVLDNDGQVVLELDHGNQMAGKHQALWNSSEMNNGTYILRMKNYHGVMKKVILSN